MRILALELSTQQGSVAWIENDQAPFVRTFANNRKHSGLFFESLQDCLKQNGQPDAIVVGLGPGSYAGVRIAIATAVGVRAASTAALVGLPSICAIETEAQDYCVIGDARRDSFFFGRINNGKLTEGPSLHSNEELAARLLEVDLPIFVSESLPLFPRATLAWPSAQKLARLVHDQISEITDSQFLEPIYLREPHITVPKVPQRVATKR
jgi:tRNA threonylcarbamoyladenosine biosynthesis protein TsaB